VGSALTSRAKSVRGEVHDERTLVSMVHTNLDTRSDSLTRTGRFYLSALSHFSGGAEQSSLSPLMASDLWFGRLGRTHGSGQELRSIPDSLAITPSMRNIRRH